MRNRVLLCDDACPILRALEFKFRAAGYDVRTATDGREAWKQIIGRPPDVLVTDILMPGMNGIDLIRLVRNDRFTRDMPILLLTAKGYELRPEEVTELRLTGVVFKPFSPQELLETVKRIIPLGDLEKCSA